MNRKALHLLFIAACISIGVLSASSVQADAKRNPEAKLVATIISRTDTASQILIVVNSLPDLPLTIKVPEPAVGLRSIVKTLSPGDEVVLQTKLGLNRTPELEAISIRSANVSWTMRFGLLVASLAFFLLVVKMMLPLNFVDFFRTAFKSTLHKEFFFWTIAIFCGVFTTSAIRVLVLRSMDFLVVEVPSSVCALAAASSLGVLVAQRIADRKIKTHAKSGWSVENGLPDQITAKAATTRHERRHSLAKLTLSVVLTAAALVEFGIITYMAGLLESLGTITYSHQAELPEIDFATLATFCVGNMAYIVRKIANVREET